MAIGVGSGGSSSVCYACATRNRNGTPDRTRFRILRTWQSKNFLLARIQYSSLSELHGAKLLLFKGVRRKDLHKRVEIDPHFVFDEFTPIARFYPSQYGMNLAFKLMNELDNEKFTGESENLNGWDEYLDSWTAKKGIDRAVIE